jgi:hypothetical protein
VEVKELMELGEEEVKMMKMEDQQEEVMQCWDFWREMNY